MQFLGKVWKVLNNEKEVRKFLNFEFGFIVCICQYFFIYKMFFGEIFIIKIKVRGDNIWFGILFLEF